MQDDQPSNNPGSLTVVGIDVGSTKRNIHANSLLEARNDSTGLRDHSPPGQEKPLLKRGNSMLQR